VYDLYEVCIVRQKSVFKIAPVHDEQNGEHQAHYPSYDMHCGELERRVLPQRVMNLREVMSKGTAQW
jgi:hypothetical protein